MFDINEYDEQDLWDTDYEADDLYTETWGNYRSVGNITAARLAAAHGMMKSFVDTFSRVGERYEVHFGKGAATFTDREARKVTITSEPLYDTDLTDEQAAKVLVGFACHEASHTRYGADHGQRVRRAFGKGARSAAALSNLLDDRYIERAFEAEYPGFTGVFVPTLRWTGRAEIATPDALDGGPLMTGIRAVRYAGSYSWDTAEQQAELKWWNDWANKYATADGKLHVKGVRAGIDHILEQQEQQPEPPQQPQQQPEPGKGDDGGQDTSGSDLNDEQDEQQADDESGSDAGSGSGEQDAEGEQDGTGQQADGAAEQQNHFNAAAKADAGEQDKALEEAVKASEMGTAGSTTDAYTAEYRDQQADEAMQEMATLENNGAGHLVEVLNMSRIDKKNPVVDGITGRTSGAAARAIRNAFARSRGGHGEITKGTTRGRCDNGSLYRIARNDPRLFHRRSSPSPDNWLVWVLVDWSGSMRGKCDETIAAARALAEASRSVPEMRMAVKTWTSAQASGMANCGIVNVWQTGDSVERLRDARYIRLGGTPDAIAMEWAHRAIRREARGSERPMIVFLSDGEGMHEALTTAVEEARKGGVEVISLALANLGAQAETYGAKRAIPYTGSITKAAGPLARLLTSIMK